MTYTKYSLLSALAAGSGCSPSLGTITSDEQPSSTSTTPTTIVTSSGIASTDATGTTSGSTTGPGGSTTATGMSEPNTGAGASTTLEGEPTTGGMMSPACPECPVCEDTAQACKNDSECAIILESCSAEDDLACVADAIKGHCPGADLFWPLVACISVNCGQPVCIAEYQACTPANGCTPLKDCIDSCGCPQDEACVTNCKGNASMAASDLYNAWGKCVLTLKPRAGLSSDRDYNNDGADDVFWYQPGIGAERLWLGTPGLKTFSEPGAFNIDPSYSAVAGDFNGNGFADVFLYAPGLPDVILDRGKDGTFTAVTPKDQTGDYIPIAGDFDNNGRDDLFWYFPGKAPAPVDDDEVWYATEKLADPDAHNFEESVPLILINGNYLPARGDFDGDSYDDIFWYSAAGAESYVWYGIKDEGKGKFYTTSKLDIPAGYLPFSGNFGIDKVNCLTCDDIFLYATEKPDFVWNGTKDRSWDPNAQPPILDGILGDMLDPFVAVPGDFNGDGPTDIIWYSGTGTDRIWYNSGNNSFEEKFLIDDMGGGSKPI